MGHHMRTIIAFTLVAGTMTALSGPSSATEPAKPQVEVTNPATRPAQPGQAAAPGSPKEGVQLSGHWVLEVRNADGTLAERREFHNDLVGANLIRDILAGRVTPGVWSVILDGLACRRIDGVVVSCATTEARAFGVPGNIVFYRTLVVEFDNPVAPTLIRLRGSVDVSGGTINGVATTLGTCEPPSGLSNHNPRFCANVLPWTTVVLNAMTSRALPGGPLTVTAGQSIFARVTLTFSTATTPQ